MKDDSLICASDFYGIKVTPDGVAELGDTAPTVANLLGLTETQVGSMHPKDFLHFHIIVGNFLG